MPLSIKNDEADRLAREITRTTGESLTEAVVISLQERLDRIRGGQTPTVVERLKRLSAEAAQLTVLDARGPDEILGYDQYGLPT